jgi:hypothetical protein
VVVLPFSTAHRKWRQQTSVTPFLRFLSFPLLLLLIMLLVVNADDLGYCARRDAGLIQSFSSGIVRSATVLMNCKDRDRLARIVAENGIPVGLHLNLTEGTPCTSIETVPSLVNERGVFHGKFAFFDELGAGRIDLAQVVFLLPSPALLECVVGRDRSQSTARSVP